MILYMEFLKPMNCEFGILFDAEGKLALIDAIMHAQAVYLQAGKPGDRLSRTIDATKMIVEVPRGDYFVMWEKRMPKLVAKRMRAKGLSRSDSRKAAPEVIKTMREMWNKRRR
jgi:hypothetical protein